jgi:hypothetical protein
VRFSNNNTRMWVGFVIPTLCFVLVKIDQCFGEPKPGIIAGIGAAANIAEIASSIGGLLSSAGQMTTKGYKEGGIYIRHKKGGCMTQEWNFTIAGILHLAYLLGMTGLPYP